MESILVVDDDQVYLDLLKLTLEAQGYRVALAGSASEAWLKAERDPPDLVLLDIVLGGEDGHALARRFRADRRFSSAPIVFFTAGAAPDERWRALDGGADDYIQKPCSPADVAARIRAILKRRAWQKKVEDGLARVQDLEHARDELLAVVLHEIGGLAVAVEAELKLATEPGALDGPGADGVKRAAEHAAEIVRLIAEVRSREGWRSQQLIESPAKGIRLGT